MLVKEVESSFEAIYYVTTKDFLTKYLEKIGNPKTVIKELEEVTIKPEKLNEKFQRISLGVYYLKGLESQRSLV
jgi:uncharacterized protein (DUF362 family)